MHSNLHLSKSNSFKPYAPLFKLTSMKCISKTHCVSGNNWTWKKEDKSISLHGSVTCLSDPAYTMTRSIAIFPVIFPPTQIGDLFLLCNWGSYFFMLFIRLLWRKELVIKLRSEWEPYFLKLQVQYENT